jgi:hypothetical protein
MDGRPGGVSLIVSEGRKEWFSRALVWFLEYLVQHIPPAVFEASGELLPLAGIVVAGGNLAEDVLLVVEPAGLG